MKTFHLLLIVVIGILISFVAVIILNFINSYDFAPSTKDNPFGINASVTYEYDIPISCPNKCNPINDFVFSYTDAKPVQLEAFNICGGVSCIKRDHIASYGIGGGSQTLGQIPWKVGDTVDIRIKVAPVTINKNGSITPYSEKMMFIDLGESKISISNNTRN